MALSLQELVDQLDAALPEMSPRMGDALADDWEQDYLLLSLSVAMNLVFTENVQGISEAQQRLAYQWLKRGMLEGDPGYRGHIVGRLLDWTAEVSDSEPEFAGHLLARPPCRRKQKIASSPVPTGFPQEVLLEMRESLPPEGPWTVLLCAPPWRSFAAS